jgi:DNA polymerase I
MLPSESSQGRSFQSEKGLNMLIMALDGNSLAYRAFFALPEDMATSGGQTTNAVYGFATMLINLVKEHKPDGVVVVFDRPEPTFRHEAIPEYKAQRDKAPDTLIQQLGLIREFLDAAGITWLEMSGFEGDDIIATLAEHSINNGNQLLIVTGDRDSYQLVRDPNVRVLYNKRGVSDYAIYDEAGIKERTGVTPHQYADYAALRGDPSDNLAGVPGVGEKTAAKLINQYGDIDGVIAHAEEQTPKLRASLLEHGERAKRNAEIMVLRTDVPVDVDITGLTPHPNMDSAKRFFDFCEFSNMYKRFADVVAKSGWSTQETASGHITVASDSAIPNDNAIPNVNVVDATVKDVVLLLKEKDISFAAAWEGEPGRSSLIGIAIHAANNGGNIAWCAAELLKDAKVATAFAHAQGVVMHDAKPLMRSLLALDIDLTGLVLDTAIAAYLIDASQSSFSLASVAQRYLGSEPRSSVEASGQLDFGGESLDDARNVAAECALFASHLAPVLRREIDAIGNTSLYDDVENPLVRVLARMEHVGIAVDVKALEEIRRHLTEQVDSLTETLHRIAGSTFNINSPVQLRKILYEDKGLTPGKKTKTGYSTDAATLEKLKDQWPEFIEPLLQYREMEKLRSTYGEGLLAEVAPDSRIHATFNQTVARTGRLSSDHPNLHNIPVRSDEGRVFRTAFVPRDTWSLLVADYNQIELRCIAHLAQDPGLISAFRAGQDIHNATAAQVFSVKPTDVTHDQRSKAKMVSYGLAYGMEAYGLSQRLGIPVDEASEILNAYFAAFPKVRAYMDNAISEARQKEYTETLFGRRRRIPELRSDNFRVRQAGERQAMNAAIQGLAADIFKIALVRMDDAITAAGYEARIVLQVHDEVVLEVPKKETQDVEKLVLDVMHQAATLDVPLEVNLAWGATWADAKG